MIQEFQDRLGSVTQGSSCMNMESLMVMDKLSIQNLLLFSDFSMKGNLPNAFNPSPLRPFYINIEEPSYLTLFKKYLCPCPISLRAYCVLLKYNSIPDSSENTKVSTIGYPFSYRICILKVYDNSVALWDWSDFIALHHHSDFSRSLLMISKL